MHLTVLNTSSGSEKTAMLGLALGAGMISFSAVYVRLAAVSPTLSAFYRVFFGALFLIVIAGIGRQRLWNGLGYFLVEVI